MTPQIVSVVHHDFRERMGYYRLYDSKQELDERFLGVVKEVLREAYMSSVYPIYQNASLLPFR